jgi:hypothetical protein
MLKSVSIIAVLLASVMPAKASGDYTSWWCGKTVVQLDVTYSVGQNSMGGDEPEPTYTLRFDYPLDAGPILPSNGTKTLRVRCIGGPT